METLSQVLRDRNLDIAAFDFAGVKEQPETSSELDWWVKEYLGPETLLSQDEALLHQQLSTERTYRSHLSALDNDFSSGHGSGLRDEDLLLAIENLEASTAAIEGHQRALEVQRVALTRIWDLDQAAATTPLSSTEQRQPADVEGELSTLRFSAEEMGMALDEDLATSQIAVSTTLKSLSAYASERLASDDRVLEAISALELASSSDRDAGTGTAETRPQPRSGPDSKAIDGWCKALVTCRAAEIRTRVQAIQKSRLLEALEEQTPNSAAGSKDGIEADVATVRGKEALQAELESLHDEVTSVAEMVVNHQLRKPITAMLARSTREKSLSRRARLDYIQSSFQYITARLDALFDCVEDMYSFHFAASEIRAASNVQRATTIVSASGRSRNLHRTGPRHPRPSLARHSSDLPGLDETFRLLRSLDMDGAADGSDMTQSREALAEAALKRAGRTDAQFAANEEAHLAALGEYLASQHGNTAMALRAVYAHSSYGTKSLADPDLVARIDALEAGIDDVAVHISAVEGPGQAGPVPAGIKAVVNNWALQA